MIHGLLATKGMTCPGHHHSLRTRAGSIPLGSQPQLTRSAENTDNTWGFLGIRDKVLSISPATKSPQSLLRPSNSWEAGQWCASCNGQCNATGRKKWGRKEALKKQDSKNLAEFKLPYNTYVSASLHAVSAPHLHQQQVQYKLLRLGVRV